MSQATKVRAKRQHTRSAIVVRRRETPGGVELTVCVKVDGEGTYYRFTPVPAAFGEAFRVAKVAGERDREVYDVLLDDHAGDSCNCKGGSYRGKCRHVGCLRALRAAGKLPLPPLASAEETLDVEPEDEAYKPGHSSTRMPF